MLVTLSIATTNNRKTCSPLLRHGVLDEGDEALERAEKHVRLSRSPTLIGLLRASCMSNLFRMIVWSSFRSNANRSMYA